MNENDESSAVPNKRMWKVILVMLVLLFLGPLLIEVRFSTYFYPIVSLSDFTIYAWTWAYSIVGYEPAGFISRSFTQIFQQAFFHSMFQFIFLGVLVGYQLGMTSMKTAKQIGYISLVPGLLILGVNLLGTLVPGATNIIAPFPVPTVTILGLLMLRSMSDEKAPDKWLSEQNTE